MCFTLGAKRKPIFDLSRQCACDVTTKRMRQNILLRVEIMNVGECREKMDMRELEYHIHTHHGQGSLIYNKQDMNEPNA